MNNFYPAQLEPLATRNRDTLINFLKGEEYVHSLQDPGEESCLCSSRGLTRACLFVAYRIPGKAAVSVAPEG